jgi:class 3 adenylate cyclase
MTDRIQNMLVKYGISDDQIPVIRDYIMKPPTGSIEWGDSDSSSDQTILLNTLIILTFDLKRYKEVTLLFLNALIEVEARLTDFDKGRLFHIKGYLDWKINNELYLACSALNQSIKILTDENFEKSDLYRARVHDTYGQILKSEGLLNDARDEYEISLALREDSDDIYGKAITLGNLGRLNIELGNFEKAVDYLLRDLEIVKKQPDNKVIEAQLLNTISQCFIDTGNYSEAEKYLKLSHQINRKENNLTGLCFNYLTFAALNLQLNKPSDSSEFLNRIDNIVGKQEIPSFLLNQIEAEKLKLFAELQHLEGKLAESVKSYWQVIDLYCNSLSFSPVDKAKLLYGFATVLKKQNNHPEAVQFYRKALRQLDITEAVKFRNKIETELISENKDSWILHTAGRFIGHHQIDILLNEAGEEGFRGEQKTVAILFCDINDFTSISEKFNPQDLILFLNEFFRLMTRSIEHYEGFVDKFIGDAVMAVFVTANDSGEEIKKICKNACMAALMMNAELERFNRKRKPGIPAINISTGIHIGATVAGLIGSPQKRSYTYMGDTVNTASRIEGIAKLLGAGILVSEQVFTQLDRKENFLLRPAGKYNPKGKDHALVVSELMGINDHTQNSMKIKEEIDAVAESLKNFQKREFSSAFKGFEDICLLFKNSQRLKGYEFLASKAKSYLIDPPPEKWDGEIRLFSK